MTDAMPATTDRQPDQQPGYEESNLDWTRNNDEAVSWFIENHRTIRQLWKLAPYTSGDDADLGARELIALIADRIEEDKSA